MPSMSLQVNSKVAGSCSMCRDRAASTWVMRTESIPRFSNRREPTIRSLGTPRTSTKQSATHSNTTLSRVSSAEAGRGMGAGLEVEGSEGTASPRMSEMTLSGTRASATSASVIQHRSRRNG